MKASMAVLFIFLSGCLFGQEYQVIHVKGEITRAGNGEALKAGDKISEDEQIQFKSRDAMAAVLNPDKGRYILKAESDDVNEGDLIYVLKSTVTPVRGGMSTRAAGINNTFDMKVYFAEAPYVWVGNTIALRVARAVFPMDNENYFFLRYSLNGEQLEKKLNFNENTLLVEKNQVFNVKDKNVDPDNADDFRLYYQSADEDPNFITEIEFVMISQEELLNVYEALKDNRYPFNDIADLFSDIYGKCDPVQVQYNVMTQ